MDIRNNSEREKLDGKSLVNAGHPLVIEIWNNVFMQYNRKANGQLELLPAKHVDTGMGFERLCMVVQKKQSNYDTDVFTPIIDEISKLSGFKYGSGGMVDIAMRVIADHLRAVSFAIADGQLPSNNKAGYVIRRILRRAVRYAYSYLNQTEPFICKLIPAFANHMGNAFPELKAQQKLIIQVIAEEEHAFLKTLSTGIGLLEQLVEKAKAEKTEIINGKSAFELYDTFGFPLDLTELILKEQSMTVNRAEFDSEMAKQKSRSRNDAVVETDDWVVVNPNETAEFIGYDYLEAEVSITRYRKVAAKGKTFYQLVFNRTPFYAESGGQIGDTGTIEGSGEIISIFDTKKENNLTIHFAEKLPKNTAANFNAKVNPKNRLDTASNHSATHLLHQALREFLGKHVEQKGSLVSPDYLRFDFSHFQKMTEDEICKVEAFVNERIRMNLQLEENRSVPFDEAKKLGAMALFGEKYGNVVRVIKFGDSVELCGGTHVQSTGQISYFKIISESAIAAGIRRIEAISGTKFQEYLQKQENLIEQVKVLLRNPQDILRSLESVITENSALQKKLEEFEKEKLNNLRKELVSTIIKIGDINVIAGNVAVESANSLKDLAFQLKGFAPNIFVVLGTEIDGKANLAVMIADELVEQKKLNAGVIIREIAKEIDGGGGGQAFFATAGGKKPEGIDKAIAKAKEIISKI